jgi:beta-glucosidase
MANRTYRYFTGDPLYPFGHGLSYTTFHYNNLRLDQTEVEAGGAVKVSLDVTNSGTQAGDEVVQLYTRQSLPFPRPLKELKGFQRISLQPGQCQTITFTLYTNQLSVYDEKLLAAVHPGRVEVMVGRSSTSLPLQTAFDIVGPPAAVNHNKVFFSDVQVQPLPFV